MNAGNHCKEPQEPLTLGHAWTCINQPAQLPYDYNDSEGSEDYASNEEINFMASKHRALILKAATKFAAGRKMPTRKRKCETPASKANKKIKQKTCSKTRQYTSDAQHLSSRLPQSPNTVEQNQNLEPDKPYLQPTKMSRLNAVLSPRIPKTTVCNTNQPAVSELPTDHNDENKRSYSVVVCSVESDSESQEQITKSNKVGATAIGSHHRNVDSDEDLMDLDTDDSPFDSQGLSDGDFNVSNFPRAGIWSSPQLPTPAQQEPMTDNTPTSSLLSTDQFHLLRPTAAGITPFLRQPHPPPIPQIRYSPIPRVVPTLRIPTCFRIAEALRLLKNQPGAGVTGQRVMAIELYAIVVNPPVDNGNSGMNTCRLADLFFPDRPPYITGTGRGVGTLIGAISTAALNFNSVVCRAIVRPPGSHVQGLGFGSSPRATGSLVPSQATVHHVYVEAIRESDWEEIEYVRGIVDPEGVEMDELKLKQHQDLHGQSRGTMLSTAVDLLK